jgi:hypothetical protein
MTAMDEYVAEGEIDPDAWTCLCGNTPMSDGFYTVNAQYQVVEPTITEWTTGLYICVRCGRAIDQDTRKVVARIDPETIEGL